MSVPEVRPCPPLHHHLGDQEVSPHTGVHPLPLLLPEAWC
jgi:hypothetical protein